MSIPDNSSEIQPGEVYEYWALQLGTAGNNILMRYNPSPDHSGSFIAEVKEKVRQA